MRQLPWRFAIRLALVAAVAVLNPGLIFAQAPPIQQNEVDFPRVPTDLELTSAGDRAVVRGVDPLGNSNIAVVTVWNTADGSMAASSPNTPPGFCSSAGFALPSDYPSDAVRVIGTKAVLIADASLPGQDHSQTLIDVLDAISLICTDFARPLNPSLGSENNYWGGQAHDLDITPDGK